MMEEREQEGQDRGRDKQHGKLVPRCAKAEALRSKDLSALKTPGWPPTPPPTPVTYCSWLFMLQNNGLSDANGVAKGYSSGIARVQGGRGGKGDRSRGAVPRPVRQGGDEGSSGPEGGSRMPGGRPRNSSAGGSEEAVQQLTEQTQGQNAEATEKWVLLEALPRGTIPLVLHVSFSSKLP
jgi:hypothetical protein